MKILKYILFAILAIIILFFGLGLLKSSVSYGHEITVDKPLKEAWAVTQDASKYGEWLDGFKSMELIEGEEQAVGAKYKVVVSPGDGQPDFEMIETVEAIKEFEQVDLSFDSDMMDFEQSLIFSENEGKTSVKTVSKVLGKGVMMRSMFAWMEMLAGSFTKQETKNMEALKKLIEANTTDYYPAPIVPDDDEIEEGDSE